MKKLTLSIAASLSFGAHAQSSVTMFGIVDAGVSRYEMTARDPLTGLQRKQTQTALSNSGNATSRLGFRGVEDLGAGWSASFWLETALANDVGNVGGTGVTSGITTSSTVFFNRRSTVSLSGPLGEIRLGRDYTPTFWNDSVFDPFTSNGVGTSIIYSATAAAAFGNVNYIRTSNTVSYFLPPNIGGFYGQLSYAFPEKVVTRDIATNSNDAGRYAGARFGYQNQSLNIALSYGEARLVDTATTGRVNKSYNVGATYDFEVVKVFAEASRVRDEFQGPGLNANYTNGLNGYLLGLSVPVGAGLIRASYSTARFLDGRPFVAGSAPRANKLALGYTYMLSKRTALYASIAKIDNKNDPAYAGGLPPAALTVGGTDPFSVATGRYLPKSALGYDFGIRHTF
ncbi:porin [uncultured Pseudacidovorax sp.]|uniref:porin n=1 Tax=uncultured Pseudacidovorax sp. TaxID=679313 RepID=UPI0025DD980D|nr:porin [uncultured Pseudacidovorax sp.]